MNNKELFKDIFENINNEISEGPDRTNMTPFIKIDKGIKQRVSWDVLHIGEHAISVRTEENIFGDHRLRKKYRNKHKIPSTYNRKMNIIWLTYDRVNTKKVYPNRYFYKTEAILSYLKAQYFHPFHFLFTIEYNKLMKKYRMNVEGTIVYWIYKHTNLIPGQSIEFMRACLEEEMEYLNTEDVDINLTELTDEDLEKIYDMMEKEKQPLN